MSQEIRDSDYLAHIQQAIVKIQRYTQGKQETDFFLDELIQDGVIRNLEIVGEAVTKLSPELKDRYSHVPWAEISGMRNRLIHGYMSVNMAIVWDTVAQLVPDLTIKISAIQREMRK